MFEHMKNYQVLLKKVSSWLKNDESLLFIHIFCHRTTPYHFEEDDGWMAQNFFSGGTMPSHDLLVRAGTIANMQPDALPSYISSRM
jgi:cyclopropane fatty-acyl-phospholipid synthase-like methyltransferase